MKLRPVLFRWHEVDVQGDGGEVRRVWAMVPHARFNVLCKRQFEANEDYPLGPIEGVPSKSRAAFFACIGEAWDQLADDDQQYPSKEHLRHVALVKAGWATHSQTVMETPKDARLFAIGMRKASEYAVIVVKGCVVDVWVAKSIATGQINGDKWKAVMAKALDWVATLARTTRKELEQHSKDGGAR